MIDSTVVKAILERIRTVPIVDTLGIKVVTCDAGYCKATSPYDHRFDGIFESVHGGILMTLADSIACFAVMTLTGPDQVLTTTDMNIRFLAPCLTDVTIEARVIKLGKTMCPVSVDLFDGVGKHIAVAQVNYIRLEKMPSRDMTDRGG